MHVESSHKQIIQKKKVIRRDAIILCGSPYSLVDCSPLRFENGGLESLSCGTIAVAFCQCDVFRYAR